jgi:transmembrane sensor
VPDADGLNAAPSARKANALDPAVIHAAAQWLVRLHSGKAGAADQAACARWRAEHPAHEQAWQKAERLARQFGAVPPELGVPVLTRQAARASRRAVLRTVAALGVAVPAAWLGWRHAPWPIWVADHATATGERREVVLADGSRLALNTATALDVVWSGAQRLVRLRQGEVYVRTAPDEHRPFIVETPQGRLRALGTRFTVRLLGDDGAAPPATLLAVQAHRVEVTPRDGGGPLVVQAGQAVRFTDSRIDPPQPATAGAVDGAPAWLQGVLYADGMRLDDFLAELSRYRPGIIRCAPEVAALRISGAFQLADTDHVLALLRDTLPVQMRLRTRWWVTVVPRDA